nr:MAG TPA: hypothetical protein [Caudoviricetes sp.]
MPYTGLLWPQARRHEKAPAGNPAGAVGEALSRGNRSLHRCGERQGLVPRRRPGSGNRG